MNFDSISKLNEKTEISQFLDRGTEIKEGVNGKGAKQNYVIIDDDPSINALPDSIKERWVVTRPLVGFDKEALEKALFILTKNINT